MAMNPLPKLGDLLGILELSAMLDPRLAWDRQEYVEELLAARFATGTTQQWLDILDAGDMWCAPVLTLDELLDSGGFEAIQMTQPVTRGGNDLLTTRSPIRLDGQILTSTKAAPTLGEGNDRIRAEFPARTAPARKATAWARTSSRE
jgi:CoA:oxalate CoA-transferase